MTEKQKLIRRIAIGVAVAFLALIIVPTIAVNGLMKTIAFLLFFVGVPALLIGGFMLMKRFVPPDPLPYDRNVKRGARVISVQALQPYLEQKQKQFEKQTATPTKLPRLSIGGVMLPSELENLGIFCMGSPGSGKTQAIAQLLSEMRERDDFRVIVFDRNGEFLEKFYQPHDLLFNPADARSVTWSHRHEQARPETIAAALVPEAKGDEAFFNDAARALLADLYERCDNNAEIWEVLSGLSLEDLTDFLKGGLSHRYFISEKTGGSVLSTLINYARFYRELPDQGEVISFVDWARSGDPRSLWLPVFEEDSELYKPLYSAAFELAIRGLLSNEEREIKTAVILDELGALNQLRSLSRLCSESRKFKGCPILGTQAGAQIRKSYGQEDLDILLQGTKTKLVLNCGDPASAELGANLIGKQERIDRLESHSSAGSTILGTYSKSESVRETFAVLPSELQNLPKLHGYLSISDGTPAAKVQITPRSYDAIAPRLEMRSKVRQIRRSA